MKLSSTYHCISLQHHHHGHTLSCTDLHHHNWSSLTVLILSHYIQQCPRVWVHFPDQSGHCYSRLLLHNRYITVKHCLDCTLCEKFVETLMLLKVLLCWFTPLIMNKLPKEENPSCLQATLASASPQELSHTVPH